MTGVGISASERWYTTYLVDEETTKENPLPGFEAVDPTCLIFFVSSADITVSNYLTDADALLRLEHRANGEILFLHHSSEPKAKRKNGDTVNRSSQLFFCSTRGAPDVFKLMPAPIDEAVRLARAKAFIQPLQIAVVAMSQTHLPLPASKDLAELLLNIIEAVVRGNFKYEHNVDWIKRANDTHDPADFSKFFEGEVRCHSAMN
jgi:hypothetical protein